MSDKPQEPQEKANGLNPALKTRTETAHDTSGSSRAPAETASVQREEGRGWPVAWLVVVVVGVLIALWILVL